MDDRKFLKLLGGPATVANYLTAKGYIITASAVSNWITRNWIPDLWRLPVRNMANDKGLEVPSDFLTREKP